MRSYASLGMIAAAGLYVAGPAVSVARGPEFDLDIIPFLTPKRRASSSVHSRFKKARSANQKRARKPNRLHISKRVRRQHRRAA